MTSNPAMTHLERARAWMNENEAYMTSGAWGRLPESLATLLAQVTNEAYERVEKEIADIIGTLKHSETNAHDDLHKIVTRVAISGLEAANLAVKELGKPKVSP